MNLAQVGRAVLASAVLAACGGGSDGGPTGNSAIDRVQVDAQVTTMYPAQTSQFIATPLDVGSHVVANAGAVTWQSSNQGVATVDANGLVTAVGIGTSQISAVIGGVNGAATATVVSSTNSAIVAMPGHVFSPVHVSIGIGGQVFYDFPSEGHNVIFAVQAGKPDDIPDTSRRSVSRTFSTAGLFRYDCTLHPGMTGDVEVLP